MKKRFVKKLMSALGCLALVAVLSPAADAYYYCKQEVITDPQSVHIANIMNDLDRQRFESGEQRQAVKSAVSYLLSESGFSALDKSPFPYMNRNAYAETVSDGTHSYTVWAAGCYAYAKWASQVVYGEGMTGEQLYVKDAEGNDIHSVWSLTAEGLKAFIRNNCQAGEHLRIDYVHSVCFLACSDEGVYFTDYAGDSKPYIRLCYATYESFFNAVRTGSSFWISDVVTLENEAEPSPEPSPEPDPEPSPEPEPEPSPEPSPEPEPDPEPNPNINPFGDVSEGDYYYDSVMWALSEGITAGLDEDSFGPAAGCTRSQVVTFLWRSAGEPEPENSGEPFTDVAEGHYYRDAVIWALENGITNGLSADSFGSEAACTRGQIVTFLWRAAGEPEPTADASPFTDVGEGDYYRDAVLWAVEKGITLGVSPDSFAPGDTCTRAQIVTLLYRACG